MSINKQINHFAACFFYFVAFIFSAHMQVLCSKDSQGWFSFVTHEHVWVCVCVWRLEIFDTWSVRLMTAHGESSTHRELLYTALLMPAVRIHWNTWLKHGAPCIAQNLAISFGFAAIQLYYLLYLSFLHLSDDQYKRP